MFSNEQLVFYSATQDNILPLTSACNVKCVFCSHRQNPPDVQVYNIGHRTLEDVETVLAFMEEDKKIVIGESVTRIMEGEPFLHPEIKTILRKIRARFPRTKLQITTNGTLLTTEILDLLEELRDIELYISLNSATLRGRKLLMGIQKDLALKAVSELKTRGVTFQGSIVAMPWIVGYADMEETIRFLDQYGAETIRIFLPGFTQLAPAGLQFPLKLSQELKDWSIAMSAKYATPLTLEPAMLNDLSAEVVGVMAKTPAAIAGFQQNDQILQIGEKKPFSRVDAFLTLVKNGNTEILIKRAGEISRLNLQKRRGERSGLVFAYDLHPDIASQVRATICRYKAKRPVLLTSMLAYPLITAMLQNIKLELPGVEMIALPVANHFFGGSIMAAGLLVVQDFLDCWENMSEKNYDLVLVPDIFLDPWGVDLCGRNFEELTEKFGIKVEVIIV